MSWNGPLDELITVGEAARLLGGTEDQVGVMIDEGLLTDRPQGDGSRALLRAEVMAATELGG
jgi:hypothetical protein